ncbi:MAG: NDP-hexose 2,3-dehydratase family protein [Nitrospirales bacterium]|nr:NDP-hexose 2,3-dehydratase family protein [Nitrospirales bacterium]
MSIKKIDIAESPAQLQSFLMETIKRSKFTISKIKMSEQDEWCISNGVLSHTSGGFFHIAGLVNWKTKEEKLVLYQPQSAYNGLALCKMDKIVYLLLQARIEPGNSTIGLFGPTIQSTPANYLRFHGGKKTAYLDLFLGCNPAIANPIGNSTQLDLGKRYFQKSKTLSYIELNELINTEESMIWVPLKVIREVLSYDNYLNPDLRSMFSVFDWDLFLDEDNIPRFSKDIDCAFLSGSSTVKKTWKLVPLSKLNHWDIQDEGIVDLCKSGVSVNIYNITSNIREVKKWSQPLLCSSNKGLIVLLTRFISNKTEFLISIESEFGISGERIIMPSYNIYPGENNENITGFEGKGKVISEMVLSEEGGRFYQNENVYQVVLIEEEIKIEKNQKWISTDSLKSLLKSSNQASIQLRCIASLVFDLMNPQTARKLL